MKRVLVLLTVLSTLVRLVQDIATTAMQFTSDMTHKNA